MESAQAWTRLPLEPEVSVDASAEAEIQRFRASLDAILGRPPMDYGSIVVRVEAPFADRLVAELAAVGLTGSLSHEDDKASVTLSAGSPQEAEPRQCAAWLAAARVAKVGATPWITGPSHPSRVWIVDDKVFSHDGGNPHAEVRRRILAQFPDERRLLAREEPGAERRERLRARRAADRREEP